MFYGVTDNYYFEEDYGLTMFLQCYGRIFSMRILGWRCFTVSQVIILSKKIMGWRCSYSVTDEFSPWEFWVGDVLRCHRQLFFRRRLWVDDVPTVLRTNFLQEDPGLAMFYAVTDNYSFEEDYGLKMILRCHGRIFSKRIMVWRCLMVSRTIILSQKVMGWRCSYSVTDEFSQREFWVDDVLCCHR